MNWIGRMIASPLAKKWLMGLTGLFLVSFLLVHLSGNFSLFKNDQGAAFNAYSHFMTTNPLIKVMEIGLVLGFLLHMLQSLYLTIQNYSARPVRYKVPAGNDSSSWNSRNMGLTGSFILVFLLIHLNSYVVKYRITKETDNIYQTVVDSFQHGWGGWYWLFYVVSMILLGLHLNHGFQSAFQTFGLNHKKYTPIINGFGWIYSVFVPLGFAIMPIYFRFFI